MKNTPKKQHQPSQEQDSTPRNSGIKWYEEDREIIMNAMQRGLIFGIPLNMAQVVRMLVRKIDLNKLTIEDYQKASIADDGRRKRKKQG